MPMNLKPFMPALLTLVLIPFGWYGGQIIARAETPTPVSAAATVPSQPAPPIPVETALAISEARADLIQAQANYNSLIDRARAAQNIPAVCGPLKLQWVQQATQNGPLTPCMVPVAAATAKGDGKSEGKK